MGGFPFSIACPASGVLFQGTFGYCLGLFQGTFGCSWLSLLQGSFLLAALLFFKAAASFFLNPLWRWRPGCTSLASSCMALLPTLLLSSKRLGGFAELAGLASIAGQHLESTETLLGVSFSFLFALPCGDSCFNELAAFFFQDASTFFQRCLLHWFWVSDSNLFQSGLQLGIFQAGQISQAKGIACFCPG